MGDLLKFQDDRAITWSVEDSFDYAKEKIKEDPHYGKKVLILLLDEEDDKYNIRQITAGIGKTSEVISMLEIAKVDCLKDMGR